jgi:2-phospho-L-lactate guanylyltransferase
VLSAAERTTLVQQLFTHTLRTIRDSQTVEQVCVVSPDPEILRWAAMFDVVPVLQPVAGLNTGLEHARRTLLAQSAPGALLVVLPDLPLLQPDNIVEMMRRSTPRAVVLAPDRHGQGTNALLVRPADALPFRFGEGSLQQHLAAAQTQTLNVDLYQVLGTAFDVDTPDDLESMWQSVVGTGTEKAISGQFCVPACLCGT